MISMGVSLSMRFQISYSASDSMLSFLQVDSFVRAKAKHIPERDSRQVDAAKNALSLTSYEDSSNWLLAAASPVRQGAKNGGPE